jgi:MFS family permease
MSLLVLLTADTPTSVWVLISLVGGIGMGILYPAMILAVQASTSVKNQAYATNMFTFLRAFGQTLGVAIGGVVFQNLIERRMLSRPLLSSMARDYSKDAVRLVQIIKDMPESETKDQIRESFVYALKWIWVVIAVLAGIALVASLFIKSYDMSSPLTEEQTPKDGES